MLLEFKGRHDHRSTAFFSAVLFVSLLLLLLRPAKAEPDWEDEDEDFDYVDPLDHPFRDTLPEDHQRRQGRERDRGRVRFRRAFGEYSRTMFATLQHV